MNVVKMINVANFLPLLAPFTCYLQMPVKLSNPLILSCSDEAVGLKIHGGIFQLGFRSATVVSNTGLTFAQRRVKPGLLVHARESCLLLPELPHTPCRTPAMWLHVPGDALAGMG